MTCDNKITIFKNCADNASRIDFNFIKRIAISTTNYTGLIRKNVDHTSKLINLIRANDENECRYWFQQLCGGYEDPFYSLPKHFICHLATSTSLNHSGLIVTPSDIFFIRSITATSSEASLPRLFNRTTKNDTFHLSYDESFGNFGIQTFHALRNNPRRDDLFWVIDNSEIINNFTQENDFFSDTNHDIYASTATPPEKNPTSAQQTQEYKISLLIPVYGRFDLFRKLILSISLSQDKELIHEILVCDDNSANSQKLKEICSEFSSLNLKIFHNKQNLGFLRNVNKYFHRACGDIVVLVNTDVELPRNWIERIAAPFKDPYVALATPLSTNAENLSLPLPAGSTWHQIDELLSKREPQYPDACTAIGYCLAIKRTLFSANLFDEIFENGYGEDSDLHYRSKELGLKSIVVDNMLVNHAHGASYNLITESRDKLRDANHAIFMRKWGTQYRKDLVSFEKYKASWFPQRSDLLLNNRLTVLFVLPGLKEIYGGISTVLKTTASLINAGIDANVVTSNDAEYKYTEGSAFHAFENISSVQNNIHEIKIVISTSFDTIPYAAKIAKLYKSRHIHFVQGPESLFSGGKFAESYFHLLSVPEEHITVSEYLTRYLLENYNISSSCIYLGPSNLVFHRDRSVSKERAVLINLNETSEKGSSSSILLAKRLSAVGYKIYGFGQWSADVPEFIDFRGWLSSPKLALMFSKCQFFIDSSYYEGLGLLSLEALRCDCIPIVRKNGSSELLYGNPDFPLLWNTTNDFEAISKLLAQATDENIENWKRVLNKKTELYDEDRSFMRFVNYLEGVMHSGSS